MAKTDSTNDQAAFDVPAFVANIESATPEDWNNFLDTLDAVTREELEAASSLSEQKTNLQEQMADNRETLRRYARRGKLPMGVVEHFYTTKNYGPRKQLSAQEKAARLRERAEALEKA